MSPCQLGAADLLLPKLHRSPFSAAGWLFELKADGFRALARSGSSASLLSRNGRSLAAEFPEIAEALAGMPECVLDAELIVADERGHPCFERVRNRAVRRLPRSIAEGRATMPASLCAFDVLWWDGQDVRSWTLIERKELLAEILPTAGMIHRLTWVEGCGEALFATACAHDLEGIIAKRVDSRYVPLVMHIVPRESIHPHDKEDVHVDRGVPPDLRRPSCQRSAYRSHCVIGILEPLG